jgi:hypothetical protein
MVGNDFLTAMEELDQFIRRGHGALKHASHAATSG